VIALFLAASVPALGSPEWIERAKTIHSTEYPVVFKLIEAARKGNEAEFQKYVASGATISISGQSTTPFTGNTIHDLATRCAPGDRVGTRLLEESDELSIYWQCPEGSPSPMTTLTFVKGKIIHAETGTAVVHVLPAPEKGAH
jgi:hypothetical protein